MFDEPDVEGGLMERREELQRVGFIGALVRMIRDDDDLGCEELREARDSVIAKLTNMVRNLESESAERDAFLAVRRLRAAIRLSSRSHPRRIPMMQIEGTIRDMRDLIFIRERPLPPIVDRDDQEP